MVGRVGGVLELRAPGIDEASVVVGDRRRQGRKRREYKEEQEFRHRFLCLCVCVCPLVSPNVLMQRSERVYEGEG